MGKSKQSWKNFVALWSRFGIEPQEASEILVKNWLDKNYTSSYGNIWRDKENRTYFIKLVNYIYEYQKKKNLKWRAACLDLAEKGDLFLANSLVLMKVIPPTYFVKMSTNTVAKLLGQFRQEFFDRGWLDNAARPEIVIEKTLRRTKLLKKKTKTRRQFIFI